MPIVIHSKLIYNFLGGGGGRKGTPYNGLYGKSLPERVFGFVTFSYLFS